METQRQHHVSRRKSRNVQEEEEEEVEEGEAKYNIRAELGRNLLS